MARKYELVNPDSLSRMSYAELLPLARSKFQHIGSRYQNDALKRFLAINLNYLSKGMYLGVPQEARKQVQEYVDCICSGEMGATEIRMTQLIAKGALRNDAITRAVVPALILKADKLRRGHTERLGTSNVDATGIVELSFALGQSLNCREVQRAFGLSRYSARPQKHLGVSGLM